MKLTVLENFEEKFYFKTSHLFWHFLVGLAALALVVGALIMLWGLTPSLKPGVHKAAYPVPVAVDAEEILQRITPPEKNVEVASKTPQSYPEAGAAATKSTTAPQPDSTEIAFQVSRDSLKALLPPKKFRWQSVGHWEQDWYSNRKWVVDSWGIDDWLKSTFKSVRANDFVAQKKLLDAYIDLIAPFALEQRLAVFRAAINYSKDEVSSSVYNMALLQTAVPFFSTEKADFIETLATFGKKNPRDGRAFIAYVNSIMSQFNPEIRSAILSVLVSSYYNYFDDIDKQKAATGAYLAMQAQFPAENQAKALDEYYKLYLAKNRDREYEIARIESAYANDLQNADYVLAAKKLHKASYRSLALKIIGSSVAAIAFVALFLVLLSIQRNIKQLREATTAGVK